jgi:hypothetical protein
MSNIIDEVLLKQLDYNVTSGVIKQFQQVVENTPGFHEIKKHLISLDKSIKEYGAFVALSSSSKFFKVKNNSEDSVQLLEKWSKKYKVQLIKVHGSDTYYIAGKYS